MILLKMDESNEAKLNECSETRQLPQRIRKGKWSKSKDRTKSGKWRKKRSDTGKRR